MGLFAKLFRRKSAGDQSNIPNEYRMAIACNQEFEELMTADKYIARSDYRYLLDKYKDIYTFFDSAKKAKHCLIIASKTMYRKQKSISFFVFMKISLT